MLNAGMPPLSRANMLQPTSVWTTHISNFRENCTVKEFHSKPNDQLKKIIGNTNRRKAAENRMTCWFCIMGTAFPYLQGLGVGPLPPLVCRQPRAGAFLGAVFGRNLESTESSTKLSDESSWSQLLALKYASTCYLMQSSAFIEVSPDSKITAQDFTCNYGKSASVAVGLDCKNVSNGCIDWRLVEHT